MNVRLKLSIQFTAIVFSILVLFSMAIYYFAADFRKNDFNTRLEEKALTTAKLLIEVKEVDSTLLNIIDKNTLNVLEDEKVVIYNDSNKPIYKSSDRITEMTEEKILNQVRRQNKIRYTQNNIEHVGMIYNFDRKDHVIIASAYDKYGFMELKNLKIILVIGLFSAFILTFLAGYFFSGRAMKPILGVIKQVNEINALRLDSRVDEGNGKDEIARLAITFNEMLERLELAFNNQRQFVSNVSHELRTPLTSLSGLLEVTLLKKRDVEEYETLLKSMLEDIKTLNSLSNGLLELANSNIDVPAFQLKNTRIDEVLFAAQSELLKTHGGDYTIKINFDEMPEEELKLLVRANENLLKIAFVNLMDNACKFSAQKRAEVNIAFSEKYIILRFSDTGIGIPDEELNKVLEPFYRASNSTQKQGHGIGLSLVKRIIEMHHGILDIHSQVGLGTQITVSLPYSQL